MASDK